MTKPDKKTEEVLDESLDAEKLKDNGKPVDEVNSENLKEDQNDKEISVDEKLKIVEQSFTPQRMAKRKK